MKDLLKVTVLTLITAVVILLAAFGASTLVIFAGLDKQAQVKILSEIKTLRCEKEAKLGELSNDCK